MTPHTIIRLLNSCVRDKLIHSTELVPENLYGSLVKWIIILVFETSVRGSNPLRPAKRIIRSVAQSGSAPGLGPGGPRFESLYSDHFYTVLVVKRLRPRVVIPIYVGSNPIKHPNKYASETW